MRKLKVAFSMSMLVLAGCASAPKESAPAADAPKKIAIEARVQLQDRVEKKTYTLTAEAVAVEPSKMRLSLIGAFGAPLGKVVMRGEQIGLLVPQQKKVFFGTVSDNAFRPVVPLPLNPRSLMAFLFGETPKGWTCETKSEKLEICSDPQSQLTLERDPRPESQQSKWTVTGEKFALTLLPTSVTTNVQIKPDTFSMPIPEGYSKHKLP